MENQKIIHVKHLFRPLDDLLLELLKSLSEKDWQKQTIAKKWKVKDVVSHLLDGNIGVLSVQRDRFFGTQPPVSNEFGAIVQWLNTSNNNWVEVSKKMSPSVLTLLHEVTGKLVNDFYESSELYTEAIFSVSWAGEDKSYNWMHLAREYTEKWHHQQQIRDVIGDNTIMSREFFYPVMETFMRALPHTFRDIHEENGMLIKVEILSEIGGVWFLEKNKNGWQLIESPSKKPDTSVAITPDISWKLFTKSLRADDVKNLVQISGNERLGLKVLEMVSVMA